MIEEGRVKEGPEISIQVGYDWRKFCTNLSE